MQGTLYRINPARAMYAIRVDSNDFSIFELLEDIELEIGDELKWSSDFPLGDAVVKNLTQGLTLQHTSKITMFQKN